MEITAGAKVICINFLSTQPRSCIREEKRKSLSIESLLAFHNPLSNNFNLKSCQQLIHIFLRIAEE